MILQKSFWNTDFIKVEHSCAASYFLETNFFFHEQTFIFYIYIFFIFHEHKPNTLNLIYT